MSALLPVLQAAFASPDPLSRSQAEKTLHQFEEQNYSEYILEASRILGSTTVPDEGRQMAALALKNAVSGRSEKFDALRRTKYMHSLDETRAEIKRNILVGLTSSSLATRNAACQAASMISRMDLASDTNGWPELIHVLNDRLQQQTVTDDATSRVVALKVVEYTFEENKNLFMNSGGNAAALGEGLTRGLLQLVVPQIAHPDRQVRLGAGSALLQSVMHLSDLVQDEGFRDAFVNKGILDLITSPDEEVSEVGWACLVTFSEEYYSALSPYIQTFGSLSTKAISESVSERLTVAALEFWITLAETELRLLNDSEGDVEPQNLICTQSYRVILPAVFECLLKPRAEEDPEEWSVQKMAGICIVHLARLLKEDILEPCISFVNAHFSQSQWVRRDAAMFVFASVMEGPSSMALAGCIDQSFDALCTSLSDPCVQVRDSTAWAISRIAEYHPQAIFKMHLPKLVDVLCNTNRDEPRVVVHICTIIYHMAVRCRAFAKTSGETPLDPHFHEITIYLNEAVMRPDASKSDLRNQAAESLACLILHTGSDQRKDVEYLALNYMKHLEASLSVPPTVDSCHAQQDFCAILYAVIVHIGPQIMQIANHLMTLLVSVASINFQGTRSVAASDAMMAVSAICTAVRGQFSQIAGPNLVALINAGLTDTTDLSFTYSCIDLCGDMARSLGADFQHHARQCTELLLNIIASCSVDTLHERQVLAKTLTTVASLIVCLGPEASVILPRISESIHNVSGIVKPLDLYGREEQEWEDFINQIREVCPVIFSNFLMSFQDRPSELLSTQDSVLFLLEWNARCDDLTDATLTNSLGLAMDACGFYDTKFNRDISVWAPFMVLTSKGSAAADPLIRQNAQLVSKLNQKKCRG
ncbi:MAG: uncharacterized protein KVP18_001646 [Porospora cf. gigantea A]|uniref:uncharacterized protein n=1 Tax=Porospora cf. gigantea A TaxID=2853593 RepID=UPI00355AA424|nr:MAG: hypothetical protein KVP18_001646 [Porospora cf. gigantea A]